MKKVFALIIAVLLVAMAGCNTVRGFGQDIQKVGGAMEDSANKKK